MSALVPFFQWCDNTIISQAIRNSRVAFPVIENFHLFALTVLLGSLVVLVLRQSTVLATRFLTIRGGFLLPIMAGLCCSISLSRLGSSRWETSTTS